VSWLGVPFTPDLSGSAVVLVAIGARLLINHPRHVARRADT